MLTLSGISKAFASAQALANVDLRLASGEIHALVGENGAGKSTLLKVAAGLVVPDGGEAAIDGRPYALGDRRHAAELGIGVVYQHFSLVETLTVAENLELGRPGATRVLRLDQARAALATWSERTGFRVDPRARVGSLSIGERQRVEILTALAWGARYLLLDEPSAVLSPPEVDTLLRVLHMLSGAGLGILLVTHKLREVEAAADRVTVMRGGSVVGRHDDAAAVSRAQLVTEMVGAQPPPRRRAPAAPAGPVRLEASALGAGRLDDVALSVRAGEVVGIAGVAGNGQHELMGALAGLLPAQGGQVRIDGRRVDGDPRAARVAGLSYIPEDRHRDALACELPVWANAVATRLPETGGWRGLDRDRIAALAERAMSRLGVRPHAPDVPAAALSGGNQQRLVIGRELDGDPAVVLAAEPTRGLDPASGAAVRSALCDAATRGAAVVVASADLDELFEIATRVVVLFEGRVVLDVPCPEGMRELVGRELVGGAMVGGALAGVSS